MYEKGNNTNAFAVMTMRMQRKLMKSIDRSTKPCHNPTKIPTSSLVVHAVKKLLLLQSQEHSSDQRHYKTNGGTTSEFASSAAVDAKNLSLP